MSVGRVAVVCALVAASFAGAGGPVSAEPGPAVATHPFSDPSWSPLRQPARISCATSNCDGYHGYHAIDFVGERGDPIHAVGAGIVHIGGVSPGCTTGQPHRGTWVWIDHGPAGQTRYHHLDTITVVEGQLVTPATQIGTMGASGDLCGIDTSYLHLEIRGSQDTTDRLPIPALAACIDGAKIVMPEHFGYATWDDVEPQAHVTPLTDDGCMPSEWPATPAPPSASIEPRVEAMSVTVSVALAGVDSVRVRLELFHPSTGQFGAATERTIPPGQRTAVVDELLPNRRYRALVSFHNSIGWSAWSAPVEARTGFLPSPPEYREHDATATTIGYKWYRGSNADADHRVAVRAAVGSSWGAWSYHAVPSSDLHIRLRNLEPGTPHQVAVRAENDYGTSDWSPAMTISTQCGATCSTSVFRSIEPARLADSRAEPTVDSMFRNTGRRPGGSRWEIGVAGRGGVPPDASAAILNLTVLNSDVGGFATVYPCGELPATSSVNYEPGSVSPNEVIAQLSADGMVCVYTQSTADVVVDVVGHVTGSPYRPISPARFADSRPAPTFDGEFRATGPRRAGTTWEIQIAGRGGVPVTAVTAVVNITATGSDGPGFVTAHPCGARPVASSLNLEKGVTRANEIVAKLSGGGALCLYTSVDVDLVVDVVGYLDDVVGYTPISPVRIADSRDEPTIDGTHRDTGRREAGTSWTIRVAGRAGVDAPAAVVANITVTGARGPGFLTVFPCGSRPIASTLNFDVGTTRPNETIARLSDGGSLCVYTQSAVHVIVDLVGYTTT